MAARFVTAGLLGLVTGTGIAAPLDGKSQSRPQSQLGHSMLSQDAKNSKILPIQTTQDAFARVDIYPLPEANDWEITTDYETGEVMFSNWFVKRLFVLRPQSVRHEFLEIEEPIELTREAAVYIQPGHHRERYVGIGNLILKPHAIIDLLKPEMHEINGYLLSVNPTYKGARFECVAVAYGQSKHTVFAISRLTRTLQSFEHRDQRGWSFLGAGWTGEYFALLGTGNESVRLDFYDESGNPVNHSQVLPLIRPGTAIDPIDRWGYAMMHPYVVVPKQGVIVTVIGSRAVVCTIL